MASVSYTLTNSRDTVFTLQVVSSWGSRHLLQIPPRSTTKFLGTVEASELRRLADWNKGAAPVVASTFDRPIGAQEADKKFVDNQELSAALSGWKLRTDQLPDILNFRVALLGGDLNDLSSLTVPLQLNELFVDRTDPDNVVLRVGDGSSVEGVVVSAPGDGAGGSGSLIASPEALALKQEADSMLSLCAIGRRQALRLKAAAPAITGGLLISIPVTDMGHNITFISSTGFYRWVDWNGVMQAQVTSNAAFTPSSAGSIPMTDERSVVTILVFPVADGASVASGSLTSMVSANGAVCYLEEIGTSVALTILNVFRVIGSVPPSLFNAPSLTSIDIKRGPLLQVEAPELPDGNNPFRFGGIYSEFALFEGWLDSVAVTQTNGSRIARLGAYCGFPEFVLDGTTGEDIKDLVWSGFEKEGSILRVKNFASLINLNFNSGPQASALVVESSPSVENLSIEPASTVSSLTVKGVALHNLTISYATFTNDFSLDIEMGIGSLLKDGEVIITEECSLSLAQVYAIIQQLNDVSSVVTTNPYGFSLGSDIFDDFVAAYPGAEAELAAKGWALYPY